MEPDPVTGEFIVLEADTVDELDDLVAARFRIAEAESDSDSRE